MPVHFVITKGYRSKKYHPKHCFRSCKVNPSKLQVVIIIDYKTHATFQGLNLIWMIKCNPSTFPDPENRGLVPPHPQN